MEYVATHKKGATVTPSHMNVLLESFVKICMQSLFKKSQPELAQLPN